MGGAIAFIINIPMSKIENHLFTKQKKLDKIRRPISLLVTLAIIILVLVLAVMIIVPEIGQTFSSLVKQIPLAVQQLQQYLSDISKKNNIVSMIMDELNINWNSIAKTITSYIQNTGGGFVDSGVHLISQIFSRIVTFIIIITFAIYVLFQKKDFYTLKMPINGGFTSLFKGVWCLFGV